MKRHISGFTLIELLVVIAIIGMLSTIAVVALNSARIRARDTKRVADVRQIQTALALFQNQNNAYPVTGEGSFALGMPGTRALCRDGIVASCVGTETYMGLIPRDPAIPVNLEGLPCPPPPLPESQTCDYSYSSGGNGDRYNIEFWLEGPIANLNVGMNCATEVGFASGSCVH